MSRKKILLFTLVVTFVLQTQNSFAQKKKNFGGDDASGHAVGISLGPAWALTDLGGANKISTPFIKDLDFPGTKFGLSAFYKYHINEWVAVRANLMWAMLHGDDRFISGPDVYAVHSDVNDAFFRKVRNLDFKTHLFQINAMAEVNLKKYDPRAYGKGDKLRWAPYVGGGVGMFFFNPWTKTFDATNVADNPYISTAEATALEEYNGKKIKLRKLATEGSSYKPINFNLSAMLGIKFNVSERISVALEGWYHQTFTDRLDDVDGNYPNLDVYTAMTPLQKAMSVRYYEIASDIDPNGYYSASIWSGNTGQERGDNNITDAKGKNDQFFNIHATVTINLLRNNKGKSFGCGSRNPYNHKFSCPKW
ncbi:MAG: outer membrane beta-barrel protein [Sphingobacteriales bacterium]|nr:MAG: outer membrane beta-barrel protein [Sphingobacteriales bacterium]